MWNASKLKSNETGYIRLLDCSRIHDILNNKTELVIVEKEKLTIQMAPEFISIFLALILFSTIFDHGTKNF